jgi:pimeloyl-ACP methyl ester carboxylesterase
LALTLRQRLTKPVVLTDLMFRSRRRPLTRTPKDAGMDYEDVAFQATDGVQLRGWFIPGAGIGPDAAPVVIFVHGWLWNRLGNVSGQVPFTDIDVDFMPPAKALHDAGFHVLLFDVRNHGESGSDLPCTYGPREAADFCGAVQAMRARPEVDGERIGAIGTSMGGNIAMYGTPQCQPVKAILAVQPTRVMTFNTNFARTELGPLGPSVLKPIDLLYRAARRPLPSRHDPGVPARQLGNTIVKYVQGTGDPWGTLEVVEEFERVTPRTAGPVVRFPSAGRYEGYNYISERADEVVDFFREHL